MVAGMAMAINVAVVVCMGFAVARTVGTEFSQGIGVGNSLDTGIGKDGGSVRKSFTPIQAGELTVTRSTFGLSVWRRLASPGTAMSSLSTSAARRAGRRGLVVEAVTNEEPSRRQPAARTRLESSAEAPSDKCIKNGQHTELHTGGRMMSVVDECLMTPPMVTMPGVKGRMEYTIDIVLASIWFEAAVPMAATVRRRGRLWQLPIVRT
jgi:hypothetical protein